MIRSRSKNMTPVPPPSLPIAPPAGSAVFGSGGLSVSAFLEGVEAKRARPTGGTGHRTRLTDIEVAIKNARMRAKSGEWSDATAPTLVGLYAIFHEITYKSLPLELDQKMEFKRAAGMARALLNMFDDDVDATVEFMKWSWKREQSRIKWANDQGKERGRFVYRFAFAASQVTDYRVEKSRRR
jgi:hypothetical protein